jgi:hypothetical protein
VTNGARYSGDGGQRPLIIAYLNWHQGNQTDILRRTHIKVSNQHRWSRLKESNCWSREQGWKLGSNLSRYRRKTLIYDSNINSSQKMSINTNSTTTIYARSLSSLVGDKTNYLFNNTSFVPKKKNNYSCSKSGRKHVHPYTPIRQAVTMLSMKCTPKKKCCAWNKCYWPVVQ